MADEVIVTIDGDEVNVVTIAEQGPPGPVGSSVPATTSTLGGIIASGHFWITANGTLYLANQTSGGSWGNSTHVAHIEVDGQGRVVDAVPVLIQPAWSSVSGKPTFANVATSGLYSDLTGLPNLSVYLLSSTANATYQPLGNYVTPGCLTYSNISGTPNLSLYLTTASAASTYQTITGMSSYLTTSAATSTYATIASLSSYLTTSAASSTYLSQSSAASTYATLSTNTFTGQQNFNSNILDKPRLQAPRETYTSPTISAGTLTLDLSASANFKVSLNAAITTLTISNVPASSMMAMFTLELTSDGTARSIAWPTVTWLSGSAPSVPATNGAKTTVVAYTFDAGTTWTAGSNR